MEKQRGRDNSLTKLQVKTNVGHSEGASGLTSIIKVVMAFEQQQIPPTYGIKKLNPKRKFASFFHNTILEQSTLHS